MTKDFGLAGVTDKLKQIKGESDTVTQIKDKSDTVTQIKDKSDTVDQVNVKSNAVKPITVLPEKGERDFRQEAFAKLNNPSAEVLHHAIETAKRKPRIGVYSPIVSAAVEYLRETIPKYSASDEARQILENEFARRYPELVRLIKLEMHDEK